MMRSFAGLRILDAEHLGATNYAPGLSGAWNFMRRDFSTPEIKKISKIFFPKFFLQTAFLPKKCFFSEKIFFSTPEIKKISKIFLKSFSPKSFSSKKK